MNLCFIELCNVLSPNNNAPALKKIKMKLKTGPPGESKLTLEMDDIYCRTTQGKNVNIATTKFSFESRK